MMDYQKAKELRKTGLFRLIAEKKFEKGQGLGASIGGALSEKFKAKGMGIKEAIDPLNIARKVFGEGLVGDLAVTGLGRLFGRKDKDIKYFGGFAKKKKKNPQYSSLGNGPIKPLVTGEPISDILAKMYNFLQRTEEKRKLQDQLEKAFRQEQIDEDERRHKELVEAIKGKGKKSFRQTATKDLKGDDDSKTLLEKIMGWAKELLVGIGNFFIKIAQLLAQITLIKKFLEKFGYKGERSDKKDKENKPKSRNRAGVPIPEKMDKTDKTEKQKPTARKEQEQKRNRTDKETRQSRAERNLPPGSKPSDVARETAKKIEEKMVKKPLTAKVKGVLAKFAIKAGLKLSTIEVPVVGQILAALTVVDLAEAIKELHDAGAFDMSKDEFKTVLTDLVKESNAKRPVRTTVTRPKAELQNNSDTKIPSQIPVDKTLSEGEKIVSVNNSVNTFGGKPPKIVSTTAARQRNVDLDRYLNKSVVPV